MVNLAYYWDTWKGRIIRAISINEAYTREKIFMNAGLTDEQFQRAMDELFDRGLLKQISDEKPFWINDVQLVNDYRLYFQGIQDEQLVWINNWRKEKGIDSERNHFFLEDNLLSDFIKQMIKRAKVDVSIVDPFVDRCHLSNGLKGMNKKGVIVKLVTRLKDFNKEKEKEREKYHLELEKEGVSITHDDSVHAKLIVVDKIVAVISSLNFTSSSSGGMSWEAGLITIEPNIVQLVYDTISNRLKT